MPTAPRKPLLVNLAWASALILTPPLLYVLSYPIVLRFNSAGPVAHTYGYRPIEWMIDETPVWRPIFWWSEVCGSRQEVSDAATLRFDEFLYKSVE